MAGWRPNPIYGPNGGEYVDEAGQIWPDPWGTLNAPLQAAGVVNPNATNPAGGSGAAPAPQMSSTPAAVADFTKATARQAPPPPAAHEPAPKRTDDLKAQLDLGALPDPNAVRAGKVAGADSGNAAGMTPPDPLTAMGTADGKPEIVNLHGKTEEQGTTGLSDEAQERQGKNITEVGKQQGEAIAATAEFGHTQAAQQAIRSRQMLTEAAQGIDKAAAEIAVQDQIQNQVNQRMKAGSAWKPDRQQLFRGDTGAFKGIAAAIAAMAGGWMQGRGLSTRNEFLPTIIKMIDDNVEDQVRQNSTTMQFLREQKGDIKAAMLELKQRQLHYAQQKLDGLALRDSSELLMAGVEKTREEMQANWAKLEQEKRQALERSETRKTTKTLTQSQAAGAGGRGSIAAMQASNQIRGLDRAIADLEQADSAGDLKSVTGWQQKLGANTFQEWFGGLPPGQQKALNALRRLEVLNRADWKTEPNGQAVQERLSQIGIAHNDREIPVMMQGLKAMRADLLQTLQHAPIGEPDPTNGAF